MPGFLPGDEHRYDSIAGLPSQSAAQPTRPQLHIRAQRLSGAGKIRSLANIMSGENLLANLRCENGVILHVQDLHTVMTMPPDPALITGVLPSVAC